MNKTFRAAMDVVLYLVVFLLIQLVFTMLVGAAGIMAGGGDMAAVGEALSTGGFDMSGKLLVVATVLSSLLTLCLFAKVGWGPVSKHWLRSKPYAVLAWAAFAALGTILPSEWLIEQMEYTMPENMEKMFEQIMGEPIGYLAIGIMAPLAEEIVFRGAVLRRLLGVCGQRWHWVAIAISAAAFGAVHGNLPQFAHAMLLGLLLGWMYYLDFLNQGSKAKIARQKIARQRKAPCPDVRQLMCGAILDKGLSFAILFVSCAKAICGKRLSLG